MTNEKTPNKVGTGKEISQKFTELCIYLDDIPKTEIKIGNLSGKKYVVLKLVRMKEKSKYGDTHIIFHKDTNVNEDERV